MYKKLIFNYLNKYKTYYLLFLALGFFFTNCQNEEDKNIPDVSGIKVDLKINRFEQDLFKVKSLEDLQNLNNQYGKIADVFFQEIIQAKKPNETPPQYFPLVQQFLNDTFVRKNYDTTQIVFTNFQNYQKDFEKVFQFYKYYFPNRPVPTILTFFSQYNYDVFPFGKDTIGVGLDFFLGSQHSDYEQIENLRYEYIRRTLTKEHLISKALRLQISNMVGSESGGRLLDLMVHNGKQLYILDCLLPETPDSIKFGYNATQTQWCRDNESGIWASFLKNNVLYEANLKKIGKLVTPSPNSPGMPPEAPGETGNYIGWQIIKQYMKRNPNITMEQLLATTDAQKILNDSKYKPRK